MLKYGNLGSKFSKANVRFQISTFEIGYMQNFVKIRKFLLFGPKRPKLSICRSSRPDLNKFAAYFHNAFPKNTSGRLLLYLGLKFSKTNVRFEVSNFKIGYMQNFVERLESLYFLAQKTQIWGFGLEF